MSVPRSPRRRPYARPYAAGLVALLGTLALAACQPGTSSGSGSPSATPASSSASPTPSASASGGTGKDDGLDAWFHDSDGDFIPDAVGKTDTCASKVCKSKAETQAHGMARIVRGTSTMIVFDSSGSMAARTSDGQTRMAAAKKSVADYVRNSPASTEKLGMMVYGQSGSNQRKDRAQSCRDIETLKAIGGLNRANVDGQLARFKPTGWTPLASAITKATKQFAGQGNRVNRVIVVTDGIEECGGDPKAAARLANRSGFNVRIDVVAMGVKKHGAASNQLQGVANAGGGRFAAVDSAAGMNAFFNQLLGEWVATADLASCVSKHFTDYSGCQAARWQKAQIDVNAEIQKLEAKGDTAQANALRTRVNQASTYFLTTLLSDGLQNAKDFSPDSADVKRIKGHLAREGKHGRAIIHAAGYDCHG